MKKENLFDAIGDVDPNLLSASEKATPKKHKVVWIKQGVAAACLCVVALGGALAVNHWIKGNAPSSLESGTTTDIGEVEIIMDDFDIEDVAYSLCLNENESITYGAITFDERVFYGLVEEGETGMAAENTYVPTAADLGAEMGTVTSCGDERLIGCTAYHFAAQPENDAICLIDVNGSYEFYTATGYTIVNEIGFNSDLILNQYGFPDTLSEISVQTPDEQALFTIEDKAILTTICGILSEKENTGLESNERRFAQAWFDAYGNDDVYFSEEDGCCMYREVVPSTEPMIVSDGEGNSTASYDPDTTIYDAAHALWSTGERILILKADNGFRLFADYYPSIRTICLGDGYYVLSDAEVAQLNELFSSFE